MKTPKTKFLFLAAVPAVCVLAALSGVLVCESSLPYMKVQLYHASAGRAVRASGSHDQFV